MSKETKDLNRVPLREFKTSLSADGKYWLFRDTTTWFIPTAYLTAIHRRHNSVVGNTSVGTTEEKTKGNGIENDRSN